MSVYIYIYVFIYMYEYIDMYIHTYMSIYIYSFDFRELISFVCLQGRPLAGRRNPRRWTAKGSCYLWRPPSASPAPPPTPVHPPSSFPSSLSSSELRDAEVYEP